MNQTELEKETALFIPTRNGGKNLKRLLFSLKNSEFQPGKLFAIDTESDDDSKNQLLNADFEVTNTSRKGFSHGKVRQQAMRRLKQYRYVIMITQDVELNDTSLGDLVLFINQRPTVGVVYGRQVASNDAKNPQDSYDKNVNYPHKSNVRNLGSKKDYGIKTVFSSDAFSVYRTEAVLAVGSFPAEVKFAEDMYMAATFVMKGYSVGYCAQAVVHHSNILTKSEMFKRYRQIGIFHREFPWIQDNFGKAEGTGIRLVITQLGASLRHGKIIDGCNVIINSAIKYVAFKSTHNTKAIEKKFSR